MQIDFTNYFAHNLCRQNCFKKLLKCMVTQSAAAQIFEEQCFEKNVLKYSWEQHKVACFEVSIVPL